MGEVGGEGCKQKAHMPLEPMPLSDEGGIGIMKRGTKVAVCHDGKWGRRVQGEVIATRNGHHIKVSFPHPETGNPVEFWARRRPAIRKSRNKPPSCLYWGKHYAWFAGWADIDYFCPWFSVSKWKEEPES